MHITPVQDATGKPLGVGISYTDVTHYRRLEDELSHAKQELETTNEELETTNEELQSTNEELETMNEELQSTNEEQRQILAELNNANAFLESVLSSVRAWWWWWWWSISACPF